LAHRELLAHREFVELLERKVLRVRGMHRRKEYRELKVPKEFKALKEPKVYKAYKVYKVYKVCKVYREPEVLKVYKELLVKTVILVVLHLNMFTKKAAS
jgi:hypothetical protein